MSKEQIVEEMKNLNHTDFRAVRLLMDLVLESAGAIGLEDSRLNDLEAELISRIDAFNALNTSVDEKLAEMTELEGKVKGYHNSVIDQISALGSSLTALEASVKKLEPK